MTQMYNYLHNTNIYFYQRSDMFRVNTDTMLLGEFYSLKDNESLLDIGCNNGALLLYALTKNSKNNHLVGIDILEEAITMAKKNITLNHLKAELYCANASEFKYPRFDRIVCNPPYFEYNETANVKKNEFLTTARFEKYLPLTELVIAFRRLIKDTGHIYMIHRSTELFRIINALAEVNLAVASMQFVYDENILHSTSVLLDIVVSSSAKTLVKKPITLKRSK